MDRYTQTNVKCGQKRNILKISGCPTKKYQGLFLGHPAYFSKCTNTHFQLLNVGAECVCVYMCMYGQGTFYIIPLLIHIT